MVEGALVMLTVLGMLIFIMDMGRILLIQQFVTERARITVRTAVVNNWDQNAVQNYLVYNSTVAPGNGGNDFGNGAGDQKPAGYLGLLPSQVSYSALGTAGAADYRLQVTVSGVPAFTWIPYIAGTYALAPMVATMPAQSLGATN
jgi:hypothetical protein